MSAPKANPVNVTPAPAAAPPRPAIAGPIDDELQLVTAARAGDISAFESLVNRYERKIFRLGHEHHREPRRRRRRDARSVSEGLPALARIRGEFAFLYLAGAHRREPGADEAAQAPAESRFARRGNRNGRRLFFRDVEDWGPSPAERFEQTQLHDILNSAISELDPSFRIVFQLRDIEEMSTEETADVLHLSVPAVKSRLLRARLKLRQKLNRYFRRSETA